MSDSDKSLRHLRHSSSVDSNDEGNFFDPGRIDSNDEAIHEGAHSDGEDLYKNGQYESELAQLRLGSGVKSSESESRRPESPEEINSNGKPKAKYIHLKNYVGLSGPSGNDRLADDLSSNKGSLISSLSSHSQDQTSPRTLDYDNRKPSVSSNEASEDDNNELPSEAPAAHPQFQYSEEEKERMRLVFQQIFSCIMPSQVSATTIGAGLGNGSDHGGSVSRENVYYRDRVKVSTTLPATQTKFKEKTRLVQTIKFHQGAIWSMKFSPCGGFLCTAGQDMNVVVWCVGALPADAHPSSEEENRAKNASPVEDTSTNRRSFGRDKKSSFVDAVELKSFINPVPYRVLEGHTGDIIDIAWSKSKFILSASTDKTVCLWHVSRTECLQFFRHPDIVTAVEFHPAHDRYYISGCFDRKLRVWDIIPDGIVQEWTQTTDTITSICFSPDGKTVAGGLIQGKVFFYDLVDFDQLKYKTQMNCRNKGGKYSRGTKVTGMCYRQQNTAYADLDADTRNGSRWRRQHNHQRPSSMQQAAQLLVSTNDSRLRLCRLDDYSLVCKYKGLKNKSMQIKASFSNDGGHVICGSEGGAVYIWSTLPKKKTSFASVMTGHKNRNDGYESFPCTSSPDVATTVAIFAPVDSVLIHLLNNSQVLSTTLPHSANQQPQADDDASGKAEPAPVAAASKPAGTSRESGAAGRPESVRVAVDYSSRIVVTADYEGSLRVFFRLS